MIPSVDAADWNRISLGLYAYCRGLDRFDRELALSAFASVVHLVYSGISEGRAIR